MTATEELRRLLDERGVEWWQSANTLGCIFTRWYSPLFGDEVCAMENGKEGLVLFDHYLTPEQAIAATLGDSVATSERHGVVWQCVLYDDLTDYPYADGYVYRRREDAEKRAKRITYVDDGVRHWVTVRKLITCWEVDE